MGLVVKILDREYTIEERTFDEDEMLKEEDLSGYTNQDTALIVIKKDMNKYSRNSTLRHELIHAFLFESGLAFNWYHTHVTGHDETFVDWIALQYPKIHAIFKELHIEE